MKQVTKQFKAKIEAFAQAIGGAKKCYATAGKLLVEMLGENEDAFEILTAQTGVAFEMLEALERVGLGKLDPELLANGSPAAWRAVKVALPMKDQKRLLNTTIAVAELDSKTGEVRRVEKRMSEIPQRQVGQVIRTNGGTAEIASFEEQAAAAIEKFKRAKVVRTKRYEIRGETVYFYADGPWTWAQLSEICNAIAPKASALQDLMSKNQISKRSSCSCASL